MKRKDKVAEYYDKYTQSYIDSGYGNILQAHRSTNIDELITVICTMAQIKDGLKILDAGCGVCGTAILIAERYNVDITSITNSKVQKEIALNNLNNAQNLKGNINVICYDFHNINKILKHEDYDIILMLESYGHSPNKKKLIKNISTLLKKNGLFYIKDYFQKDIIGSRERQRKMKKGIKSLKKSYKYNLPNLYDTIKFLQENKLELETIRRNPIKIGVQYFLKNFEKINNLDHDKKSEKYSYLQPLELVFIKPESLDAKIE